MCVQIIFHYLLAKSNISGVYKMTLMAKLEMREEKYG
jgi:hypothetical protein